MSTPRASSLFYSPNANPNKNEHGSNQGLIPYNNNGWKYELDETVAFVVKKII